ncbi:TPA: DUF1642 domain-containing protein [Streptococcus pneumoniae]
MKKQKLIEKINKIAIETPFPKSKIVDYLEVIKLIEQLDEPQPVKVKQFVADWYEKKKHDLNHYIWDYIYNWNHQEESEFKRWMNCSITSFQTLINMHQFGYEVEKEKKYKVVLLNYNDGHLNLVNVRTLGNNIIFFTKRTQFEPRSFELTKNEIISSGFGWVFDCPGIEIEEVE